MYFPRTDYVAYGRLPVETLVHHAECLGIDSNQLFEEFLVAITNDNKNNANTCYLFLTHIRIKVADYVEIVRNTESMYPEERRVATPKVESVLERIDATIEAMSATYTVKFNA